jgi:RHS repeat-associated protein
MPMQPGSVALSATTASSFRGSDGRFEVQIPAGAISAQDLNQAGGSISLRVTQIAPPSGSNAGGSGQFSLGAYLLQLVDAHGRLLNHGLRQPVQVRYHLLPKEQALHLEHAYLLLNGGVADDALRIQGVVASATGNTVVSTLGVQTARATALDPSAHVLSATVPLATPSTSMSWDSDSPIATFGKPDPASVSLSAGALSYTQPIDIPAGPGDLTPPLQLVYSSEAVNEQHNASAAASWVGEGWNLSLGAITWAEHNVLAGCKNNCTANWENVWYLNDVYGTSSQLIPPNINVSTYYDDTANYYCATGNPNAYPCPILWHTADETHDKIYAYVGPIDIGQPTHPPCFRVWHPNGIMEEYGCTADSLQYYYEAGIGAVVNAWYVDLITDPQGNQIQVTYQRDMASWTSPVTGKTYTYPRDVELATVSYDSPTCHNAQTMCTGSAWQPLVRIVFNASHSPALFTKGGSWGSCNTGTNMRCDDPLDLSSSGGLPAPIIQNTFALNSIQVQVRSSGSASWNTLRTYNLSYEQSGPTTITDPASGLQRSVAGMFDLTRLQEVGSTGATALMYSGMDNSTSQSYAYMKVFDLSSRNIVVGPNTTLSYWVYPESSAVQSGVSGSNSTCVAIDMIFSDGSDLRDSGAVDQNGVKLHPAQQCGHLKLDQWNLVISNIGAVKNGKTINRIDVGYDQPANTGGYRGYIDDIVISNPGSSTPLFSSDFESGSPQPTWTNTVDSSGGGGIANVGGFCCSLSGPEAGTRQETFHTDSAALPQVVFGYTTLTNTYVDSFYHPTPSTNCGPSWNTGNGSGCLLWSQSYAGNSRFLSSISNGQGLSQTFTWSIAHNNSHGVPGGGSNNANPFYCNSHMNGYPCNEADDSGWSRAVLTQASTTTLRLSQNGQGGAQTSTPVTETTAYSYQLTYPLPAQECSDCVAGMYWGNQNDVDYLSYYNGIFMGFAQVTVSPPDGSLEVHKYYAGEGWGIYDPSQVTCFTAAPCHNDPWWDLANAAHGQEYQALYYDTDGSTLLKEVDTSYQAICPPPGVAGTPASSQYGTWDGKLVSALDHNNPVAVCDIRKTQQKVQIFDGSSNSVVTTTSWSYDNYDRVTQEVTTGNGGTPAQVVKNYSYVWNDAVQATQSSASGTYLIDFVALSTVEDGSGNRLSCQYTSYDGQGYATGQTSALTLGEATEKDAYADCGSSSNNYTPTGKSAATTVYDVYGNVVASTDADANAGIGGHVGCTVGSSQYTSCTTYDSTFAVYPIASANALNQVSRTSYANTGATFGYGTWPQSTTDVNNQTTSYSYDFLGRMTAQVLPGESSGLQTQQWLYSDWCSGAAAQGPCLEIDEIDRLNSTTTTISRAFYDGEGRLVETRTPGPAGQDVIIYAFYDSSGRLFFKSDPYFVPAYSGPPGPAAYSLPDTTQPGTTTTYDGLDRVLSVTDPNSFTTQTAYSVVCGVQGTSDSGCYEQTAVTDANGHRSASLVGALGKENYQQQYTGDSSHPYTLYSTTAYTYDSAGQLLATRSPDGSLATITYDDLGRAIQQQDPDRGTSTASYDPNGNVIQTVDARGAAGTVYYGYDGLNRLLWRNSSNTPTGAWVTYTYDSTANGNMGVGRVTGEQFSGPANLSGSYSYTYDARGRQIAETVTVNGASYTVQASYNDAGLLTSQTYPDGEVVTPGYDTNGWLIGLTTTQNTTTTVLASAIQYQGNAGAAGKATAMLLGNSRYSFTRSFDAGLRVTSLVYKNQSSGAVLYQEQPQYDAANNVVAATTTLPTGDTDVQAFCYDALNRLTWAGASGTPPCGSTLNAGTLTAAQYQQGYSYDAEGRLTTGPAGSYTYGESAHPHAVTSTSSGFSASYDAAGNMICRAPNSSVTCGGSTPTGQQLSYDAEGRLVHWQNMPTAPSSSVDDLYDGEGNRVVQRATVGGSTTTTIYLGQLEEIQQSASGTQTLTYYSLGGAPVAEGVNGSYYYFGYDVLGSLVVALDSGGNVAGTQLYGPYGNQRYTTGSLPTSLGYAGQRADTVTGLDYDVARYYDPVVGQFLTADTVQGNEQGQDPYAYVGGNPETRTDPTGHDSIPLPLLRLISKDRVLCFLLIWGLVCDYTVLGTCSSRHVPCQQLDLNIDPNEEKRLSAAYEEFNSEIKSGGAGGRGEDDSSSRFSRRPRRGGKDHHGPLRGQGQQEQNRINSRRTQRLRGALKAGRRGMYRSISSSWEWAAQQGLWRLGAERAYWEELTYSPSSDTEAFQPTHGYAPLGSGWDSDGSGVPAVVQQQTFWQMLQGVWNAVSDAVSQLVQGAEPAPVEPGPVCACAPDPLDLPDSSGDEPFVE